MYLGGGVVEVVMLAFSVLEVGERWMGAVEKKKKTLTRQSIKKIARLCWEDG